MYKLSFSTQAKYSENCTQIVHKACNLKFWVVTVFAFVCIRTHTRVWVTRKLIVNSAALALPKIATKSFIMVTFILRWRTQLILPSHLNHIYHQLLRMSLKLNVVADTHGIRSLFQQCVWTKICVCVECWLIGHGRSRCKKRLYRKFTHKLR